MKKIAYLFILALFLLSIIFFAKNAFAEQTFPAQNQVANQCQDVVNYGNKLQSEYGNAAVVQMWKNSHPGCYPNHLRTSNAGPIFDALDSEFNTLYEATEGIAVSLFMFFAFLILLVAGTKIAFLGEDIKIATGRAFLSLLISFGLIEMGPTVLNHVLEQFQSWGDGMSATAFEQMKTTLTTNTTSSNNIFAELVQFFPAGAALDPVRIAELGIDSGSNVSSSFINSLSYPHWYSVIFDLPNLLTGLIFANLDVVVQVIAFLILGLDAAFLLVEGKILIAIAPLAFFMLTIKDVHNSAAYRTIIDKVLGLSVKLFLFYTLVFAAIAAHFIALSKSFVGFH